ncbi:WSC-domain-containing protein [Amniculicola lignicola CBS 123094]|uniref:WSC-domain-containing protein n=1 Tax=Amniculicola lignicola CBS 123094 TaxID=1392246 RepID=A0A6A5VZ93_9PLEO|nr:WSC-domain-containing protein [Amniculicola lignicola CBS 123094]
MPATAIKIALGLAALAPIVSSTYSQPACPSFQNYTYSGCYVDNPSDRTFTVRPDGTPYSNMTVYDCTAMCKGNGFRFAGLEYYGECFCGTMIGADSAPETACNYPCKGKLSDICGGTDILSVWEDPTFGDSQIGDADDYSYDGCYTDLNGGRILAINPPDYNRSSATHETCLDTCGGLGYGYAGLEYYGECYCGNTLDYSNTRAAESDCSYPCNGDAGQICGGSARINLWKFPDLLSDAPCGSNPQPSSSSSSSSTSRSSSSSSSSSLPSSSSSSTPKPPSSSSSSSSTLSPPSSSSSTRTTSTVYPPSSSSSSSRPSSTTPPPVTSSTSSWKTSIPSTSSWKTSTSTSIPSNTYKPPPYTPTQSTKTPTPAPTPSCVCSTAAPWAGNKCVGSIPLPCVGCNEKDSERPQFPFKLFNNKDYNKCPKYSPSQPKNACYDACKTQYDWCINYSDECKKNKGKKGYEDGDVAQKKCVQQYKDCYKINNGVGNQGQCPAKQNSNDRTSDKWFSWLSGWIKAWDWN